MKKINFSKIQYFYVGVFALILLLNCLTPLAADDYAYSFGVSGERINSIADILKYQQHYYFTWGGALCSTFFCTIVSLGWKAVL